MFCTSINFNLIPYSIPNMPPNSFQAYVNECEEDILKKLLGVQLYDEFVAALDALPDEWVSAPTTYGIGDEVVYGVSVWESLVVDNTATPVEGASWTKVEDNKWLKLSKGSPFTHSNSQYEWNGMEDMLKPYIWYSWTKDTFDNNTGIGVVVANAANSEVISPALRLARAYNDFARRADSLYWFIYNANIPESTVYAEWKYCCPGRLNIFNF